MPRRQDHNNRAHVCPVRTTALCVTDSLCSFAVGWVWPGLLKAILFCFCCPDVPFPRFFCPFMLLHSTRILLLFSSRRSFLSPFPARVCAFTAPPSSTQLALATPTPSPRQATPRLRPNSCLSAVLNKKVRSSDVEGASCCPFERGHWIFASPSSFFGLPLFSLGGFVLFSFPAAHPQSLGLFLAGPRNDPTARQPEHT